MVTQNKNSPVSLPQMNNKHKYDQIAFQNSNPE